MAKKSLKTAAALMGAYKLMSPTVVDMSDSSKSPKKTELTLSDDKGGSAVLEEKYRPAAEEIVSKPLMVSGKTASEVASYIRSPYARPKTDAEKKSEADEAQKKTGKSYWRSGSGAPITSPGGPLVGADGDSFQPGGKKGGAIKGKTIRPKRFNDGGATSTYPFQSAGSAAPGSTTTVNVNGAPDATTAPADQMLTAPVQAMKKGGSVKGWGMARGARKAKVY